MFVVITIPRQISEQESESCEAVFVRHLPPRAVFVDEAKHRAAPRIFPELLSESQRGRLLSL